MKFSENWLREWVNPDVDTQTLCEQLTMAGLEVDDTAPVAPSLERVVVGRIISAAPHPDADSLQVCMVEAGQSAPLQIVCGAPNARAGLLAPLALPGAQLPGGININETVLRGVTSTGMLCGANELAIGEESGGLLELDTTAAPGTSLRDHLELDDTIIEIDLTPNRGDCLSIQGVAREVGVWNRLAVTPPAYPVHTAAHDAQVGVAIADTAACPVYVGRVIRGIDPTARTPDWLRERLRRGGIRPISILVDITNYVMLELGQPMHAFDHAKLQGRVEVRFAADGETVTLLDGGEVHLSSGCLVIADDSGPIALAGVMGGAATAVGDVTDSVFLESACFMPAAMAGLGRRYKRHTDALHRFERGVSPALQRVAIERATALILEIAGGAAGPLTMAGNAEPQTSRTISLRHARIERLLGSDVAAAEVEDILSRLELDVRAAGRRRWQVTSPAFRFDLEQEADLIEEIARIHGYERLPARPRRVSAQLAAVPEAHTPKHVLRQVLCQRGYYEAITYSFVDAALQERLDPKAQPVGLDNPIARQYAQMRTTLWSSLLPAWLYNVRRQQPRVRLFEFGLRFARDDSAELGIAQVPTLAGIISGPVTPQQWGEASRSVDFFDLKGDIEALLAVGGATSTYRFEAAQHPALHPGRSARIYGDDVAIGWLGQLHPDIKKYNVNNHVPYLFELDSKFVEQAVIPRYVRLSDYPQMRRDLAVVVPEKVNAAKLFDAVADADIEHLQDVHIFDVFRGGELDKDCKSIALGLIFQSELSTLTDEEVDDAIQRLSVELERRCGATLRGR